MFKKAERKKVYLKIALTGPSGAGKTMSAILIASGIGKKIALVDTENGSASLYSDRYPFDTAEITPPYTNNKYLEAIKSAETAGYDVLILDSLSHGWSGDGGMLATKEALDARGGNSYTNWGKITKEHEQLKGAILNCKIHLIATMRSKQDYILETNDKGKQAPRKVGMAPIQREGMEYEFTTVLDLGMDHSAQASKDRTGLFDGQIFKPTKETGETLMKWLQSGIPISKDDLELLAQICKDNGWAREDVRETCAREFNKSFGALDSREFEALIVEIRDKPKGKGMLQAAIESAKSAAQKSEALAIEEQKRIDEPMPELDFESFEPHRVK